MTEYFEQGNGVVANATFTNGIVTREFVEDGENVEWVSGVSPGVLREWANLIEFVYGYDEHQALDVGLAEAFSERTEVPAVVVGHAEHDRWVMMCPRRDCNAGSREKQSPEEREVPVP